MIPEIPVEAVPEGSVPTGRGRPGREVPEWLMKNIQRSAQQGEWLSATIQEEQHGKQLVELLHYVHRSTRAPYAQYKVATRREDSSNGVRVLFRASVEAPDEPPATPEPLTAKEGVQQPKGRRSVSGGRRAAG